MVDAHSAFRIRSGLGNKGTVFRATRNLGEQAEVANLSGGAQFNPTLHLVSSGGGNDSTSGKILTFHIFSAREKEEQGAYHHIDVVRTGSSS